MLQSILIEMDEMRNKSKGKIETIYKTPRNSIKSFLHVKLNNKIITPLFTIYRVKSSEATKTLLVLFLFFTKAD